MSQQQSTARPYIPVWRGQDAQRQRDEQIKALIKEREQSNYR